MGSRQILNVDGDEPLEEEIVSVFSNESISTTVIHIPSGGMIFTRPLTGEVTEVGEDGRGIWMEGVLRTGPAVHSINEGFLPGVEGFLPDMSVGLDLPPKGEDVLMLRMVDRKGSILYYGMLRDGAGFVARSGFRWSSCDFNDEDFVTYVEVGEDEGYHIDFGPVSFPVGEGVAASIRGGRFAATDVILLEKFHEAGAPKI